MNFFLIFALIFFTIIVAIFLQKLVNSPILIGLLFFSVFILISAITGNTNFIIVSVVLGIIAFISAFLFCIDAISLIIVIIVMMLVLQI